MPFTAAALVTAGIGAYKAIKGAGDSADAKRRGMYNLRPTYDIAPEYFANQGIASNLAQGGLPDSTKNYYQTNAERGLGSSLSASLQTGGGVNSISDLYDKFDQNNRAIASADAQQKIENIKNLMAANNSLADQKTQKWVIDKYQPYLDTAKSVAAEKAQGAGEVNSGLNSIAGAVSSYAGAKTKQEDDINDNTGGNINDPNNPGYKAAHPGYIEYDSGVHPADKAIRHEAIQAGNPSAMNVNMPDNYDQLGDFNMDSRRTAISGLLNKYQNSPYYSGLNSYLQPQAA